MSLVPEPPEVRAWPFASMAAALPQWTTARTSAALGAGILVALTLTLGPLRGRSAAAEPELNEETAL